MINYYNSPKNGRSAMFNNEILSLFDLNKFSKLITSSSQKRFCQVLLTMVFLMGSIGVKAQVANYTFAASSGSYTALSGGTSWQSGATIATNAVSPAITLPWAFTYNSKSYNSIYISNNGFIAFANIAGNAPAAGNILPISTNSSSSTTSSGYDGAITAFGMDLVASTVSGAAPDISYGTSGSDFVIQYTDLARTGQAATERITFQIRLTQTTNVINLVYNTPTVSAGTTFPQVGLRGASHYDWKNLSGSAATTWTAPTVSNTTGIATSTLTMRFSTAATATSPVAGQTFTFTPFAALAAPTYASIPASENFDAVSWANGYSTGDLPSAASWRTWPSYGDRSIRRNNVSTGSSSGWLSTSGSFTVSSPASGGTAMFNSFNATFSSNGYMDYYLNFSGTTGTKTLTFNHISSETAALNIYLSTDGGQTFGAALATYNTAQTSWTTRTVNLGTSVSSTCVVRFECISNFGGTGSNIGIDNVSVTGPCAVPTSLAATASAGTSTLTTIPGSFTAAAVAPTGYLVVRTATNVQPVPVTATTYTVGNNAIGYIEYVNAAAGSWTSTGLTPNTTYYYWVFSYNNTTCAGGPVYSATATTFSASTTTCTSFNATISINGAAAVPGVSYPTIGAATADLVACGISQPTVLEIASGYTTEASFPLVLASVPGSSATNTITIREASGVTGKTITSANTTATIDINGGKYWIIDGRSGGTGSTKDLTISNTSTATGGTAVRFINDANNNTLKYLNLAALYASTASGVVNFSTTTGSNGNDSNTIDNCNIDGGAAGTASPTTVAVNGIYSSGSTTTAATNNSGNTISNNNIFNFFGAATSSNGILISTGNTDWTITGNSIYQTATRTATSGSTQTGINISYTSGNNFVVTGNFIGGDSANAAVTTQKWNVTGAVTSNLFQGIALSVGTTTASSVQNNIIRNIQFQSAVSGGNVFNGIIVTNGNVNIGNTTGNTLGSNAVTSTTAAAASISLLQSTNNGGIGNGIYNTGSGTVVISNNSVGGFYLAAAAGANTLGHTFYGVRTASATTTISGNTIGSTTNANNIYSVGSLNTTTNANTLTGILATSGTNSITGNTVRNMNYAATGGTGPSTAVTVLGISTTGGTNTITGNTVSDLNNVSANTGTSLSASVIGISNTSTTAPLNISSNTVNALANTHTAATAAVLVTGIYNNGPSGSSNIVAKNFVHSLTSTSTAGVISGIQVGGGTTTYQNNMISLGNGITTSAQINGINEPLGTDNFYHNSVYIGGSNVVSGTVNTFAFNSSQTVNTRNYRNNIFMNSRSNTSGTGTHYAIAVGGSTVNPTGLTSNNNMLFVNGTGGAIGRFNVVSRTTISDWRTATGQDAASFENNPQYLDPTNATPDLHINPSVITFVEANGVDVGVTDDYDNQTRSGLTPVDIGADAGNFTGQDVAAPIISYTALGNTTVGSNQTLTATITDSGSGVPTSGGGLPVLYYKVNSGSYTAVTGVSIGSNQYTFTFGAAATTPNDVVSYYVVAQDLAATPNVSVFPSAGAAGFSATPPAASTPPTTPSTYTAFATISGVKTVCASGCDFTSLTNAAGAFATINGSIVTGNLELQIASDLTAETGANALNAFASPYTLKLYPTGSSRTVSGSLNSAALIKLNGADRVTIDGSIGGTGTDRSLTFTNTSSTSGSTIAISSLGNGSGATDNTIKNCIVTTGNTSSTTSTSYGISVGGATPGTAGGDNDNVTLTNNSISQATFGIYANGNATVSAGGMDNLVISGNSIGSSGAATTYIFKTGIVVGNGLNANISQNTIFNLNNTVQTTLTGIDVQAGFTASTISRNNINNIFAGNTGGWGAWGISVNTGTATSNLTIANNILHSINGTNFSSFTNSSSIGITVGMNAATGGVNLYYNSVSMTGSMGTGTTTAVTTALYVGSNASVLDIRNNIFSNTQVATNTSQKNFAVYSVAANTAYTLINFNDYFVTNSFNAASAVLGFLGSDQTTLAAWKTATGKDAASLSQNPQFLSATDLHINTTVTAYVESAATPIVGITTDFDGDTRNATTPDVGADEGNFIAPVNNDIAATAFIDPVNAGSKVVGVAFTPQASFTNAGVLAQTNVTVRYRIVNASLTEVYNQTATIASLASLATTTVSFPSVTIATSGAYTIYAKAELAGDTVSTNDEITGTLTITDPYTSSTVTQNTNNVLAGSNTQQVIGLQVVTSAATGTLTSLTFNTNGTTNLADISNAKIYYTGTSSTFATTTQYGSTVAVPSGSHIVNGSQALSNGTNYFWLTYDVAALATTGNVMDGEFTNLTVNGIVRTPTVTAPAGARTIVSPMAGTYLIGASQVFPNFTSITAANADLTIRGVSAAVVFELQSDYAATETFPIVMGTVAGVSAINTVTIKPGTGVTKTISGSNSTTLFNLNGAKFVTIDGSNTVSGTTKDLTISNTNTSGSAITLINDAANNTIKNTILNGVSTANTSGVIILSTSTGTDGNDNNLISNNDISGGATSTGVGILNSGSGTTTNASIKNSGNIIQNNNIFNFSINGIRDNGGTIGTIYRGNNIYEVATQTTSLTGIIVRTANAEGFTFTGNKIYDLKTTSNGTVYGIDLANMTNGTTGTITNNTISLNATTPLTVYGIFDETNATGRLYDIYHNTISISGTVTGASNSAAYYYSIASTTNFKNNILSNTRNGGTGKHYAYRSIADVASLTSDYNDLYVGGGTGNVLASNATDQATLTAWQTATSKDANSVNILPIFTSATDLHITAASLGLDNLGTPIATVTTDFDGETRNATTPDLGADEFTIPACITANGGTATGTTQFCTSGTPTIAASGYSTGTGTTYQWYSSTSSSNYPSGGSPVAGQSNPASLITGALTTTTYYWLHVTCGTNSSSADSNMITVTINTPATISASAAAPTICSGGSGTTLTATGAASYSWTSNPAGFTSTSATPAVNPTVTTVYTANGIDANGCTAVAGTVTVTVTQTPSAISVISNASPVCSGSVVTLNATGGLISGTPSSVTVASPTTGSAIPDVSSTGVSQNIAVAGIPAGATITKVEVKVNISHIFDADVEVNLKAPNGKIVNLFADQGSTGDNFTDTIITSDTSASAMSTGSAPFTGTFKADLTAESSLIATGTFGGNYTTTFSDLFSISNGTWTVTAYDDFANDTGILSNSSITIYYTTPPQNAPLSWSATAGNLYTSAAAASVNDGVNGLVDSGLYTTVYAKPSSPATSVTYTATATNVGCTSTGSTIVNVTPLPSFTVSPITICKGQTGTLTAVSAGSNSYSWAPVGGGTTLTGNPRSVSPTVTTTYNVTATSNDTTPACQFTQPVTVTVNDPGTIVSSTLTRTVSPGQDTTFEVVTTGVVTYQWQVNNNVDGWQDILAANPDYTGETSDILNVNNITLGFDTYQYRCLVTGLAPCTTLVPIVGVLNVTNTGFSTQPASVNLCSASSTSFTIVTTGDEPYNVQWQISTDNGANFSDIVDGLDGTTGLTFSGANEFSPKTLFVSGVTAAHNGYQFKCQLDFFLDSSIATLTVNTPVTFVQNLSTSAVNLCKVANTTNLSIETSGSVGAIVWKYATSASGPWNNLAGLPAGTTYSATNPSANHYNLAVMTTTATPVGSYFYKAFITGSGSGPDKCPDVESNAANIVINNPTVVVTPSSAVYCTPGTGITLTASGANTYSWTPDNGSLNATTGAIVIATPSSNTTYTVTGTDTFGCFNTATTTVNTGASFTASATNNTALSCPGSSISLSGSAVLNEPITTGVPVGSYTFENTIASFNSIVGGSGTVALTLNSSAGSPPVVATTDDGISDAQTLPFTFHFGGNNFTSFRMSTNGWISFDTAVTNNSTYAPLYTPLSSTSITNVISAFSRDLDSNNTSGETYHVQTVGSSPNRIVKIEWANLKSFSTFVNPNTGNVQVWLYETSNKVEIRYGDFTTSSGRTSSGTVQVGLKGASTAAANVRSLSNTGSWTTPTVGTSSSSTVALGTFSAPLLPDNGRLYRFSPINNGSTTFTYAWTSTPAGFTSSSQNPTVTPSVATTYNLTATSNAGCTATSSVLVNVQTAAPTITVQPTAVTTVCQGASASFSVTATSATTMTYQWRRNGSNLTNGTGISGATSSSLSLTGAGVLAGNYDVVVSTCTSLNSTSTIAVLTVNPLPTATISGSTTLCQNATAPTVTFTGAAGTAPYTFTYKINGGSNQTITTTSGNSVSLTVPSTTAGTFIYSLVSVADSSTTACSQTQVGAAVVIVNALPTAAVVSSNSPICQGSALNLTSTPPTTPSYTLTNNSGVSFVDISTTGTSIGTLSDDNSNNITIPSFTFNGTAYTTARVGTNGAIVFGSTSGTIVAANAALPSTANGAGNAFIAPFWDDLDVQLTPSIRTQTVGNLFIIQYTNLSHDAFTTGGITYQVQLNTVTGAIHFVYQDITFGNATYDAGASATIGINYSSTAALQYTSNAASLVNGQSITFAPNTYTYSWTGPNSFTSAVQNPTIANATTAASGTYTLEITNGNGCKASSTVNATVNPLPTATIAGTVTLCRNSAAPTVTFTGANGTAPYTFTYKLNGGANQTISTTSGNSVTLTVSTATAGVYSYSLVSVQDSSSSTCSQTQAGTATVTVVENITYYRDADNDGYGNPAITLISCNASEPGYVLNNTDCNDNSATVHPGAPEICFNGIDDDCNGSLYNGCSPALTSILPSFCGSTLTKAKATITASAATYSGPYTVTYLFRITNLNTNVTVDLPRAYRNFNLGMTNIIEYGTTYSVSVAAIVNGEQQPFSSACLISTPGVPTTKLVQCGLTATSMSSSIPCSSVNYALAYQFEVALASNPGVVKEFERLYNNFQMIMVNSAPNALPLLYDTDYNVRVKVKVNIDGEEVWGPYGQMCTVRTPMAPEAFMAACDEDGITPATMSTILYANTINYTSLYRFTLISEELDYSQTIEHTFNNFRLSDFDALAPLTPGATYSIIVDVQLFGNYYPGKDCQLIVPFPAKMVAATPFEVKAHPNPFAENFMIDVKTENQAAIDVKVYDMVGRLVEQRKVNVSELETTSIGDRYPSGVYNVIVTQGEEVKTLRVVKR
ncbi:BNR-repeat neuraminidase N-terminal domain-containing protein [Flavobacterium terrisoli]|uniref:BNR-repeat neuraminidase N-terminal domain-containing protein n=1 Tax=Flavobacterium terrisoli TaxID=3242195 RepID=UPI002543F6BF|nr:BNR-repeat neuraminidase N-terminal domain-containing protein [Flavobacterium buctense]